MITRTIRIDSYTYDKLKAMSKYYKISINNLLIELIQLGYLVKEKENVDEIKNK